MNKSKLFWLIPAIVGAISYSISAAIYRPDKSTLVGTLFALLAFLCILTLIVFTFRDRPKPNTTPYKYSYTIRWSPDDDEWIARIPEFPGLSGCGDTLQEALYQAQTALVLYIKVYNDKGWPLPEPSMMVPRPLRIP